MKLPSFHLSTLLLGCIFSGAMLGLSVMRNEWHFERFVPDIDFDCVLNRTLSGGSREPRYQLPSVEDLINARAYSANGSECARVATDGAGIDVFSKDAKGEFSVLKAHLKNEHKIVWLQFSKDGGNVAAVCQDGIAVFVRGWQTQQPVMWIAAGSLAALLVVFARAVYTRIKQWRR
ncbi:MAG TPA: hypothetical protein VKX17_03535 [Planctomycetota bacterium]|nr:hypothetical protein [Planctomycetota bacterium]